MTHLPDTPPPAVLQSRGACANNAYPDRDWCSPEINEQTRCADICRSCPVRRVCLEWALDNAEASCVWGGAVPYHLRATLGVDRAGAPRKSARPMTCLMCGARARPVGQDAKTVTVQCPKCNLRWTRLLALNERRKKFAVPQSAAGARAGAS